MELLITGRCHFDTFVVMFCIRGVETQHQNLSAELSHFIVLYLQTNNKPNSWANIALWRRFFQEEEQKERLLEELFMEVIDERHTMETMRPIDSWFHTDERRLETLRAHRDAIQGASRVPPPRTPQDATQLIQFPVLHIPLGDNPARYMPQ